MFFQEQIKSVKEQSKIIMVSKSKDYNLFLWYLDGCVAGGLGKGFSKTLAYLHQKVGSPHAKKSTSIIIRYRLC